MKLTIEIDAESPREAERLRRLADAIDAANDDSPTRAVAESRPKPKAKKPQRVVEPTADELAKVTDMDERRVERDALAQGAYKR